MKAKNILSDDNTVVNIKRTDIGYRTMLLTIPAIQAEQDDLSDKMYEPRRNWPWFSTIIMMYLVRVWRQTVKL